MCKTFLQMFVLFVVTISLICTVLSGQLLAIYGPVWVIAANCQGDGGVLVFPIVLAYIIFVLGQIIAAFNISKAIEER